MTTTGPSLCHPSSCVTLRVEHLVAVGGILTAKDIVLFFFFKYLFVEHAP